MRFNTVTWGLSLLGLVAANPLVRSPSLDNKLALRQDEGPEEFCDPENCGNCETKRDFPSDVTPVLEQRDVPRPEEGQIDAWFSEQWSGGLVYEVPHQEEDDFTARFRPFEAEAFLMGVKGMCGCTSVIIASEIGGFIVGYLHPPGTSHPILHLRSAQARELLLYYLLTITYSHTTGNARTSRPRSAGMTASFKRT